MKKLLRKRSMLLVALLVSLCMPVVAQETTVSKTSSWGNSSGPVGDTGVITYNGANASSGWKGSYLQLSANNLLTITATDGYTITNLVLTFNNNNNTGGTKTVKTYKGDTELTYTGTPSSGNNSYTIPVSNGANKVTVSGNSRMRITQISVTYTKADPVDPTLKIEGTTTLAIGQTSQLTVSGSDGAKTYSSNNTSVATVDANGLVTAKGAGTATITVNIAATQTYAAASASIQITVNAAPTTPDTEEPEVLDGGGATVYYIRNVSTGLYIKYGGS